jgi:endonuclease/exonuclease/phosphatase family metal-dependent hydrolase
MITVLFWNVGARPRRHLIADLAVNHDVDVLLLAEVVDKPVDLLKVLNKTSIAYNHVKPIGNTKITIFVRFPTSFFSPVSETDRLTIRKLNPPGLDDILLAVVHFPSKMAWSEASQAQECGSLAHLVREAEEKVGHRKTILVGDLNMNPFEDGVVSAAGLHAVMARDVARRGTRTVQGTQYPFVYNPMWSRFGDGSPGPAGTYYHSRSEHRVYFWNMYDQILVRPALLDRFKLDDLLILEHTGEQALLTAAGRPNRRVGSDHLPILFRLS